MKNPVLMHINYGEMGFNSFGTRSVDDICRMAAEIGFDGVEFRSDPPKELSGLSIEEYYAQIAAGQKKYGLSHIVLGVMASGCMDPDKDVRMKCAALAVKKARLAKDLFGSTVLNTFASPVRSAIPTVPATSYEFHGSAAATEEIRERLVDTYREIAKGIEPLGVRFAFETHHNYPHDLPAAVRKLVDLIGSPAIGVNMDYGNIVYFPTKPTVSETIDILGDKIFYVHLKNSVNRVGTSLSDGEINHREYLRKLRAVGYAGFITLEAPRPGDRVWFAREDLAYYKAVVSSL